MQTQAGNNECHLLANNNMTIHALAKTLVIFQHLLMLPNLTVLSTGRFNFQGWPRFH